MRNFFELWRREMGAYFHTSMAYGLGAIFMALTGFSFWRMVDRLARMPADAVNAIGMLFDSPLYWMAMLTMAPLLTMRLFSEERKTGTLEMLLSAPVSSVQVVLAKFAGAYTMFLLMWLPTVAYSWVLRRFGTEVGVDFGPLAAGYLGTALIGGFFLSAGLFCSLCSRHQMVAGLLCVAVLGILFYTGLPGRGGAGWMEFFSSTQHMADFARGTVDTRAVFWYASSAVLMLFLSVLLLESRRLR